MSAAGFGYLARCDAMVGRGLSLDVVQDLKTAGNEPLLADLERLDDARLVEVNRAYVARGRCIEAVGGFSVADVDAEAVRRVAELGGMSVEQAAEGVRAMVEAFRYVEPAPDPDAEKWAHLAAADELRLVETTDGRRVAYPVFRPPLLWQDDGDQA